MWNKFTKREYKDNRPLNLFAVDCGGYDTTGEVQLREAKDGIFLEFCKYHDKKGHWSIIERFKVEIKEDRWWRVRKGLKLMGMVKK